jgi:hypothetical protein
LQSFLAVVRAQAAQVATPLLSSNFRANYRLKRKINEIFKISGISERKKRKIKIKSRKKGGRWRKGMENGILKY